MNEKFYLSSCPLTLDIQNVQFYLLSQKVIFQRDFVFYIFDFVSPEILACLFIKLYICIVRNASQLVFTTFPSPFITSPLIFNASQLHFNTFSSPFNTSVAPYTALHCLLMLLCRPLSFCSSPF